MKLFYGGRHYGVRLLGGDECDVIAAEIPDGFDWAAGECRKITDF